MIDIIVACRIFSTLFIHTLISLAGRISTSAAVDPSITSQTPDLAIGTDQGEHPARISITSLARGPHHRASIQGVGHLP